MPEPGSGGVLGGVDSLIGGCEPEPESMPELGLLPGVIGAEGVNPPEGCRVYW